MQNTTVDISEEPLHFLTEYSNIPISFVVRSVFELTVENGGFGGFALHERSLETPYLKDYDAIEENKPSDLVRTFDLTNWGILAARQNGSLIGGALVTYKTSDVFMLEGRDDLAVLWDIRIVPEQRGKGTGAILFSAVEQWSKKRRCKSLKIETQNINVPACRFYAKCGCTLGAINRFTYPELPNEIQLLWYKQLS